MYKVYFIELKIVIPIFFFFQWELDNVTWHDIQRKIREVQSEQQMCIHKEQLTELDIYHRILRYFIPLHIPMYSSFFNKINQKFRFKNYMVAMMNKNLIPSKIMIPILGECVCFNSGLRRCIELILFSKFTYNLHNIVF